MDTKFKLGDGRPMNLEKHARVVKYNGGNIKDTLDILANITPYGKKLLAAQSEEEFNHLLRAEVPMFYDESEITRWNPVGNPFKTATNAKFGSAMRVDANNYLQTLEPVTFGGNPFTIQFWGSIVNISEQSVKRNLVKAGEVIFQAYTTNNSSAPRGVSLTNGTNTNSQTFNTATLHHYEIGYTGGNLMLFVDGTKKFTVSGAISKAPRTITIGGATGFYIDEFRILDGVCAHGANFTPPSAQYPVTSDTISLLHFD